MRVCDKESVIDLLLFTAFLAVIVTGFAIINRLRRWAKPISSHKLWPAIAQQVRDSAVNSNIDFTINAYWGRVDFILVFMYNNSLCAVFMTDR